jgi:hypothetical protein
LIAPDPRVYSLDTSALLDGLERYYPESAFPALWERVDDLIADGQLVASEEVVEEAGKKDALAKAWFEERDAALFVVPTDADIAGRVQAILMAHPRLVKEMKGRNRADAFVIAVAQVRGATVVTGEGADGNDNRPKIPYICGQMGSFPRSRSRLPRRVAPTPAWPTDRLLPIGDSNQRRRLALLGSSSTRLSTRRRRSCGTTYNLVPAGTRATHKREDVVGFLSQDAGPQLMR